MLNSGSSKLDEILAAGRSDTKYFGLGYTEKSIGGKTVFLNGNTSNVKNDEDLKASVATPARTPTVITSGRVGVATPGRTTTASPGKKKENRWIPICHYYNKRGHIKPQCYKYFAYLRRENQERYTPHRPVKRKFVKKFKSKFYIARTPMKVVKEIVIKDKTFRRKQVADMHGE